MSGKEHDYRIFVGGLSWDVSEGQLEDAFSRYGKILDVQVMLDRDTGRPRGFGFLTFADRLAMEDAIREMDGRELGDRPISVNKAQPRMAGEEPDRGYGGGYSSGGRGSYGGGDRSAGQDSCFKCGRAGHWARDCPLEGGGRSARAVSPPPRSRYGGGGARGDRYGSDHRYADDQYDRGHYADRERYDGRDDRYGSRDRYANDRYPPSNDRFTSSRYGASDRYPQNGYGKERGFDRDVGPRGSDRDVGSRGSDRDVGPRGGERYAAGGPARDEVRNFRDRAAGPYDRPRRGGRPPAFDRY